jgi:hypothetical protein
MLDFGVHDKWPAKMVEKKWEQIHPESAKGNVSFSGMPLLSEPSYPRTTISPGPESRLMADGGLLLGSDPEWTTRMVEERSSTGEPSRTYPSGGQ